MERYSRRDGRRRRRRRVERAEVEEEEGGVVFYERGEKVKESGCKRRVGLRLRKPAAESRPGKKSNVF